MGHIKDAFSKGLIVADFVVMQGDTPELYIPKEAQVCRRIDGIYFEDLYMDLKRLYALDFPVWGLGLKGRLGKLTHP